MSEPNEMDGKTLTQEEMQEKMESFGAPTDFARIVSEICFKNDKLFSQWGAALNRLMKKEKIDLTKINPDIMIRAFNYCGKKKNPVGFVSAEDLSRLFTDIYLNDEELCSCWGTELKRLLRSGGSISADDLIDSLRQTERLVVVLNCFDPKDFADAITEEYSKNDKIFSLWKNEINRLMKEKMITVLNIEKALMRSESTVKRLRRRPPASSHRFYVLCLAILFGLDPSGTNRLLSLAGLGGLYAKTIDDCIWFYQIMNGQSYTPLADHELLLEKVRQRLNVSPEEIKAAETAEDEEYDEDDGADDETQGTAVELESWVEADADAKAAAEAAEANGTPQPDDEPAPHYNTESMEIDLFQHLSSEEEFLEFIYENRNTYYSAFDNLHKMIEKLINPIDGEEKRYSYSLFKEYPTFQRLHYNQHSKTDPKRNGKPVTRQYLVALSIHLGLNPEETSDLLQAAHQDPISGTDILELALLFISSMIYMEAPQFYDPTSDDSYAEDALELLQDKNRGPACYYAEKLRELDDALKEKKKEDEAAGVKKRKYVGLSASDLRFKTFIKLLEKSPVDE